MSLSTMSFDAKQGTLKLKQTVPTLSEEQISTELFNSGSEVRVHPSGNFVYSGNRGHDSISAFSVNQTTGELTLTQQEPIRGCWPRNFNLAPSGKWMLAAGAESNTLAVFKIDQGTGKLQYARAIASVPAPICVLVEPKR
jgi:6-phosphogluconolactonase